MTINFDRKIEELLRKTEGAFFLPATMSAYNHKDLLAHMDLKDLLREVFEAGVAYADYQDSYDSGYHDGYQEGLRDAE